MPMTMTKRKRTTSSYSAPKRIKLFNRSVASYPVYKAVGTTTLKKGQIELKYDVGSIAASSVPSAGTVTNLTTIANGTDDFQRIGKMINYKGFKGKMNLSPVANHNGAITTVSIVYDKAPNGAIPGFTTIFDTAGPLALPNQDYIGRFEVLWQKTFSTTANDALAYVYNPAPHADIKVALGNKKCQFSGTGNTFSNPLAVADGVASGDAVNKGQLDAVNTAITSGRYYSSSGMGAHTLPSSGTWAVWISAYGTNYDSNYSVNIDGGLMLSFHNSFVGNFRSTGMTVISGSSFTLSNGANNPTVDSVVAIKLS